jgi:hypothetical protein
MITEEAVQDGYEKPEDHTKFNPVLHAWQTPEEYVEWNARCLRRLAEEQERRRTRPTLEERIRDIVREELG